MISQEQLYIVVNLIDLHSRTTDQEISMKLKTLINKVMDDFSKDEGVPHELEN